MKPDIICTLGTTTDDKKILEEMIDAGMSCARMNTAYATIDEYQRRLDLLREVKDIDVMMDIKGPQVRLCSDRAYMIDADDRIIAGFQDENVHFTKDFYNDVSIGNHVCIDNGTIDTKIIKKGDRKLHLEVICPGEGYIHKQMAVNIPDHRLHVSRLSYKDVNAIDFAVKNDIDYIAMSFVRDFRDVETANRVAYALMRKHNKKNAPGIVAKIEERDGIMNLTGTIDYAKQNNIKFGVMVARGDLAVELPVESLPGAQERIIYTCKRNDSYVITATALLESLQYNYLPTRSEVNDVYNAIVQGSDALMLSGETSNGVDPVNATRVLKNLINMYSEQDSG